MAMAPGHPQCYTSSSMDTTGWHLDFIPNWLHGASRGTFDLKLLHRLIAFPYSCVSITSPLTISHPRARGVLLMGNGDTCERKSVMRQFIHSPLAKSLALLGFLTISATVSAQVVPPPRVDHDGDCDYDIIDRFLLLDIFPLTYVCENDADDRVPWWLHDFDLDGTCEYDLTNNNTDDYGLLDDPYGVLDDFQFYWCVKDIDADNTTGNWRYQMDNSYAQYTENGHTDYPAEVVENVAIFDQSWFGFWPALWRDKNDDECDTKFTGGLHVLLDPTPDSSWDHADHKCTWQARIRRRFVVQSLDPDVDGVTSTDWLDCWEDYLDLHHDRVMDAIDELCGLSSQQQFDGYGVVDYEQMWFDWEFTKVCGTGCVGMDDWESKVEQINSGALVDMNFLNYMQGQWAFTPAWSGVVHNWAHLTNKDELYENSWNYFMHVFVMETLEACRDASNANAKWGFYGYPARSTDLDDTYNTAAETMNDNLFWLWDHDDDGNGVWDDGVDMLLPSIYGHYSTTLNASYSECSCPQYPYTKTNLPYRTTIAGMHEILNDTNYDGDALLLPFVTRIYGGNKCAGDINDMVSWQQFLIPKFYLADGVMIWDNIDRSMTGSSDPAGKLESLVDGGLWDKIITEQTCLDN